MTRSQKNAIERYWQTYGIDFRESLLELPVEYSSVTLEIGIGNGEALIAMALEGPESFFIGIEVHKPGIGRCLNHIHQQSVRNVRVINHDAVEVLQHMLATGSCDRVLLFFPDPWPKKRHHKRRIVNRPFRDLIYRCLKPLGSIHIATDWQDYAESIAQQFLNDGRFENRGDAQGFSERPAYRPLTHFEQRGRRLGHGVWDLIFIKKQDSS